MNPSSLLIANQQMESQPINVGLLAVIEQVYGLVGGWGSAGEMPASLWMLTATLSASWRRTLNGGSV